jgi:cysteine desulfurase family protein
MNSVYFDNAATTFPKAPGVSTAIVNYIDNIGANAGRGSYKSTYAAGAVIFETRELIAELFHYNNPMNVIFTSNITHSLNIVIKGLLKKGDHVIVSAMEHNAVMRPLLSMLEQGIEIDRVPCSIDGSLNLDAFEGFIKSNTKLVIMTHASNVCGTILPIEEVGKICKARGLYFVLDAAQSAGVLDVDFNRLHLNGLAFTGHKGMLGPQGIGGLILDDSLSEHIKPFIEGGTGSTSESEHQPSFMPDKFESGTLNLPGIFGLNASLKYLKETGIDQIHMHEMMLTERFLEKIKNFPYVKLIGLENSSHRTAVVSLDFTNEDNSEIAFRLDNEFGIMTRVGLHCAPNAHKTLGTFPKGSVRFSFGNFNTVEQVDYCVASLAKILELQNLVLIL